MRNLAMVILLLFIQSATAQSAPKSVKTVRVQGAATPLYVVETDGTVRVDWRRVEIAAQSAELTDSDIARALIAVRDGKAQAMP